MIRRRCQGTPMSRGVVGSRRLGWFSELDRFLHQSGCFIPRQHSLSASRSLWAEGRSTEADGVHHGRTLRLIIRRGSCAKRNQPIGARCPPPEKEPAPAGRHLSARPAGVRPPGPPHSRPSASRCWSTTISSSGSLNSSSGSVWCSSPASSPGWSRRRGGSPGHWPPSTAGRCATP
jgi:hypothetical protein